MLRSALLLALWIALAGAGSQARADDTIRVEDIRFERSLADDAWLLWARFSVPAGPRIEQALRDGVTLHYVVEFDLTRPRWWWWDQKTVEARQAHTLSYHLLTQRFRAGIDGDVREFATLAEAAQAVAQVSGWSVVADLEPNTSYEARLRLRFDRDRLPKSYQLGAMTNNDWDIDSEWKRFTLTTATSASAR
ncbi:MAG: DUF4390 domain-containing protein [Burkholderiaceae bacterium]|jgi:hypothetical protein|nr:DUF4390 domain-containing protein [Burkholderiaceae bacterium]MEB2317473.1 DUF4390 domain-containing protein [Pseudomonadota bacterium]